MKKSKLLIILMKFYSFNWLRYLSLPFLFSIFQAKRVVNKEERSENVSLPRLENATHITGTQFTSSFGTVSVKKTYFVYILRSTKNKRFFIGTTDDLYGCLERHNTGRNISTVDMFPFELIYYEAYIYFEDAKNREKYLRSNAGQKFLKKNLSRYFKFTPPVNIHRILRVVPYISLLLLTIIGPALLVLLMTPKQSIAAWFDDAWGYRKSLTITHNAALTNQKVKFDIDTQTLITNGQMQSDCGDSRFTDNNGNLLPYYLDSAGGACNTNSTDYYVLFPVVNNGTTVIYHYYGNPSAPNGTKGSQLNYPTLSPSGGAASAGSEERSPGPILYWKMDEGQGTTVYDSSSSQNNGTFDATWKPEHDCISGKCTYVVTGDAHSFDTTSLTSLSQLTTGTISVWAKITAANSFQSLFNIYRAADTTGTGIALGYDNQVSGGVNLLGEGYKDGTLEWSFNVSSSHFNAIAETNTWHLYTLTHDGTTPALYIDGKPVPITFTTSTDKTVWLKGVLTDAGSDADQLSIGILYANSTPFDEATGFFDDFKIYPYLRTASQIKSDVISRGSNKGVAASMGNQETQFLNDGLIGYWKMDDTWVNGAGNLPAVTGGSAGLTGDYFDGMGFDTYVNTYTDTTVDFDPADTTLGTNRANGDDTFSVYWSGEVKASFSETYTFYTTSDDGVRLYVNGSTLVNNWTDHGPTEDSNTIALTANQWYPIILQFYENTGGAAIQLEYSSASEARKIIPSTNLRTVTRAAGSCGSSASGPVDSSGNALDMDQLACQAITNSIGKFSYSGNFEVDNTNYDTIADSTTISLTGDLSIAAWINPESATASTQFDIAGKWDGSNQSYLLAQYGSELRFYLDSASNYITTTTASLVLGSWQHVAATYNANTRTAKIFVNGKEQTTTLTGSIPASIGDDTGRFHIGADSSTTTATNFYDGSIDDVRLYKRTLSPAEVRQLYNWAPGPVGWWKLDENNGVSYTDSSGNENTGEQTTDSHIPKWIIGKYGSAVRFDGVDDSIDIPNNSAMYLGTTTQSYTVEAWINPNDVTSGGYILTKGQNSWGNGNIDYSMFLDPSGGTQYVGFEILDGTNWPGVGGSSIPGAAIPINTWSHVTGVREVNTKKLKLYINGSLVDQQTDTTTGSVTNGEPLILGNRPGDDTPYKGGLDDIKIYTYERTPTQIIEDMNGGHPAGGSPVGSQLIFSRFDEQNGTTINNSGFGGSTYNGTDSGAAWLTNTSCKSNGCLNFDTNTDNVTYGDLSFIDNIASMSASMWINPQTLSTNDMILSKANTSSQRVFQMKTNDSACTSGSCEVKIMISSGSAADTSNYCLTSGMKLTNSSWQHIAFIYDGYQSVANRITVYSNGRPVTCTVTGTIPNTMISGTTSALKLGKGDDGTPDSFNGYIDEFKLYNAALTQDSILIDYNQGSAVNFGVGAPTPEPAQLSDGAGTAPVGYWTFNENKDNTCSGGTADVCDKSGNGFDLSNAGKVNWSTGKIGSALKFGGSSSDKTTYNDTGVSSLDISGSFTIQGWVKFNNLNTDFQSILVKHATSDSTGNYSLASGANALTGRDELDCAFNDGGSNPSLDTTSANLTPNTWYFITCVFNTTANTFTIYVNGTQSIQDTGVTTDPITGNNDLFIGNDSAGLWANPLDGYIDEVKIYNYARTQSQIMYDYNRGAPIGWWKFDECQGTTTYDSSGNSFHGTWSGITTGSNTAAGNCSSGTSTHAWYNGVTGKYNSSLSFDGTNDSVSTTSDSALNLTDTLSISAWVNPTSLSNSILPIVTRLDGSNNGYEFYLRNASTSVAFCVNANCGPDGGSNNISLNTWQHVVATVTSGNVVIMYVNGKQVASGTHSGTITSNSSTLTIGSDLVGSDYFQGKIDDVRIYNYKLSSTQVLKLYNDGSSVFFGPATGSP